MPPHRVAGFFCTSPQPTAFSIVKAIAEVEPDTRAPVVAMAMDDVIAVFRTSPIAIADFNMDSAIEVSITMDSHIVAVGESSRRGPA